MPWNKMDKIVDGLWLGSLMAVADHAALSRAGITHILALYDPCFQYEGLARVPPPEFGIVFYKIKAEDVPLQDLRQYFAGAINFIHEARCQGGQVLVHCMMGISRSTTILISYLMAVTTLSLAEVLPAVKAERSIAEPNDGFKRQLQDFSKSGAASQINSLLTKNFPNWNYKKDKEEIKFLVKKYKQGMKSTK